MIRNGLFIALVAFLSSESLFASHVIFREAPKGPPNVLPSAFRTMVLDEDALRTALDAMPGSIALLGPDGTVSEFAVMEVPVMDGELARKFPEIRTFRGQGITDRTE